MKVLVVGSGGREHALVWKIAQSNKVEKIYCAPGNAGISKLATCVDIKADDITGLLQFAKKQAIDLTVVGPEAPLTDGIVDEFNAAGLRIFGPSKAAAQLEGSKALAKHFMAKYNIPTAKYAAFADAKEALQHVRDKNCPLVVKASGLAAGKGVIICQHIADALDAVRRVLIDKEFGEEAGKQVVIEELLVGEEVSVLAFTDGKTIVPMVPSQDHKRIFDGDKGPNTGGMGAYAPAPIYTAELNNIVVKNILEPTLKGLNKHGWQFKGVIYAGLMITPDGPKVLEYNVRFGDPETQPVLSLLETDMVEIMEAIIDQRLDTLEIKWKKGAAVCVVTAAQGYPGNYKKGEVITGLNDIEEAVVFHAGTALQDGQVVTSGGRVLGVTSVGDNLSEAINKVYANVEKINFTGVQYRKDIGSKGLKK
jgi:phosphoribosylamine--glycine ligase